MMDITVKPLPGTCRWYDILATESRSLPISFKNNRIYSIVERQNSGAGVRVNVDGRTGFSHTNDAARMENALQRALDLAPYGDTEEFSLPAVKPGVTFEPFDEEIAHFSLDRELSAGAVHIAKILAEFPESQTDLGIGISEGAKRIINSEGLDCSHRYSSYSVSLSTTLVSADGERLSVSEGRATLKPADYSALVEKLLWKLRPARTPRPARSGRVSAIFTPKAFSGLLGILLSGLSARPVYKGLSPFAGKLGEKILNKRLTLIDDPLVPGSVYSYPFDDEGCEAYAKPVIDRGEIRVFVSDLKYSGLLGVRPTGNASRGYASLPSISFSNVVMTEGETPRARMLADIKYGILVDQFIGLGQSNTLTGDFSASLDLAYLVEGGELSGRVKDCMISGNLFELLAGDIVLSSEREQYGSVLLPYLCLPAVNFTI